MKVLIVDDEFYARKALIKIIKEYNNTIEIIGDVENGKQAIIKIKESLPDVVFVDIRMPVMDGLELAKYINNYFPDIIIVIVSGHADFKYAQAAIDYGVKEYLLKPLDKPKFKEQLISIEKCVNDIKEKNKSYQKLVEQAKESISVLENQALTRFIHGEDTRLETIKTYINNLNNNYICCVFGVAEKVIGLESKIIIELNNYIKEDFFSFTDDYDNKKVITIYYEEDLNKKFKHIINSIYKVCNSLNGKYKEKVYAGISNIHREHNSLPKAFKEALYSFSYHIIKEDRLIYCFSEIIQRREYIISLDAEQEKIIYLELEKADYERVKNFLDSLFAEIKESFISLENFQDIINKITGILNRYCKDMNDSTNSSKFDYVDNHQISSYESLDCIYKSILNHVYRITNLTIKMTKTKPNMIDDIKRYIDKHYGENISLNHLSKYKYYVNPSYLSRLFKDQTGVSFSSYLLDFRLKKAYQMLKDTNISISDIASVTGFNDVSYFIKAFKKNYNLTPGKVRYLK